MIFAFFSRRFRSWLVLALVLPLVGRVLEAVGVRVGGRSPRAGSVLRSTGGMLRRPEPTRRGPLGRRRRP